MPDAGVGGTRRGRLALQPLPHHGDLLPDPGGPAVGTQPSQRRHGQPDPLRHRGAGLQRGPPAEQGALGGDPPAQRVRHGAFGKWHQTPDWEITPTGPFDRWPTGEGFQKFYGILSGESSQFTPTLYDGTTAIDPPATEEEGYHLSEDLVDQAQRWITDVRRNSSDQPWFTYLSFGATHAPFHLPEAWRGRNRGEFAHGWNAQREQTLARQKELGIVPADTELAPWTPGVPVWQELSEVEQEAAERLMEAYASFAEHTDAQIGRLVEFLRERGELDNTLIVYVLRDNGAAAEGGLVGTLNEHLVFNGLPESPERIVEHADEIGGPHTYPHYPVGWAVGMNAPFQWTKQVASHFGGTRNGLIVHWPARLGARGEIREQFSHVIDVAPTILEAAGLPEPEAVNGIEQEPLEGTSLAYSFDDDSAPDRHTTQYFEIFGNRGIYHEGWTAVTKHRTPWEIARRDGHSYADDAWELYDTNVDWAQAHDVAAERPEKLAELQALFLLEAAKYNVLPLDDRVGRPGPGETARPRLASQDRVTLTPTDRYVVSSRLPILTNTSFQVVIEFEADRDGSEGVLIAQGGRFGGWAIHLIDGRPVYTHNRAGLDWTDITGSAVPAGLHTLEFRFRYDGNGWGAGGLGEFWLAGARIGSGRLERTVPFTFSTNETTNIGIDRGSPVTEAYATGSGNPFTGQVHSVTLLPGLDAVAVDEQELLRVELARQ